MDMSAKLIGYFKLPSAQHYLIIDPDTRTVTHHSRGGQTEILSRAAQGTLRLDPPGLSLDIAELTG